MDHLSYDLVEEVASYLPRSELETIAKVAGRSPALENWSIASEDQLDRRFLLQVCVHLQGYNDQKNPRIRVSVQKHLSDGRREEWDFKNWRYAWIHDIDIWALLDDDLGTMDAPEETFKESNIHQALRLVSLPVDPNPRSELIVGYDYIDEVYDYANRDIFPDNLVDLFWKTIENTQKEFAAVYVYNIQGHNIDAFGEFIADSIERGTSLDLLSYSGLSFTMSRICEAIAPLFGKTRGRPLKVSLPCDVLEAADVELIIDAWLQSDGTFEEKEVECGEMLGPEEVECFTVNGKYEAVTLGDSSCRYLAHPTKRSSLLIGYNEIRVVKFEPWHIRVDFQSIDSVIGKWREGCGFYAWHGEKSCYFSFKEADDWKKLVEKYGPAVDGANRLPIAHLTGTTFLEVTKSDDWFEIRLKHEFYTKRRLESLISDWEKGNGETLLNRLTKMQVQIWKPLFSSLPDFYSHPLRNARLLPKQILYENVGSDVLRISIVPIDPEEVEDWNLELLFGSLQV